MTTSEHGESIEHFLQGDIVIQVPAAPVSLQASRRRKDTVAMAIMNAMKDIQNVLTNDVAIDIEWFVSEQARYEMDSAPDVDNIIKPLLDTICGPDGIMVDDCQVQSIRCSWLDIRTNQQGIIITIRPNQDDGVFRRGKLAFLRFDNGLCFPINTEWFEADKLSVLKAIAQTTQYGLRIREELHNHGFTDVERSPLPAQRLFHISRVQGFQVVDASSLGPA